ncbi:hypothetical protein ANTPLA_LOCUS7380 [Anthophora plagiata]
MDERWEPRRISANSSCVCCTISIRNSPGVRFLSPEDFNTLNSRSSPTLSLPEVKIRPRTCCKSCTGITENDQWKQPDRFPCQGGSSSCHEKLEHHGDTTEDELMEMRQKNHSLTTCNLHNVTSSENTCDTDGEQLEAFSIGVTRCLKKLEKPYALKAQAEIQRILRNVIIESKNNSL